MSSVKWQELVLAYPDTVYLGYERLSEDAIPSAVLKPRQKLSRLSVYPLFICATTLLAVFFGISLILALTSQYFLDWGSALIGFLGTAGLALVGWFSKRQIRD